MTPTPFSPTPQRVIARVLSRVVADGDCLVSTYSIGSHGYAQVGWQAGGVRIMRLCHRVAWAAVNGPILSDMTIDHLCRNRPCVNVEHMRLLTNVANATDNGQGRKTHCPRDHEYDETNTYINPLGHRICRACARERRQAA